MDTSKYFLERDDVHDLNQSQKKEVQRSASGASGIVDQRDLWLEVFS